MKTRFIVLLAAILALCMALSGCGNENSTTSAASDAGAATGSNSAEANAAFTGYWRMVLEEDDEGVFIAEADMDVIRSLGYDCYIGIYDSGDCSWVYTTHAYDSQLDLASIADSDTVKTTFRKSNNTLVTFDATLKFDGDTLAIEVGDGIYTFKRISPNDFPAGDETQAKRDAYTYQSWMTSGNAVMELSGEELRWLLYCLDYEWDDSNTARCKQPYGLASLTVMGSGKSYLSEDEMRSLQAGAQGSPYVFVLTSTEFKSAEAAFEACFGKSATEYASSDSVFVSTVSDAAGTDYLVLITATGGEGLYGVTISGKDGLGVLEELLGDSLGDSVPEAYENLVNYLNSL
ncbi:MAG: hypothetical protein Q4D34_07520 [Eggerthellaceae bacterium]|nr:hypothetical protein [Eggerthellaceae bacterium]